MRLIRYQVKRDNSLLSSNSCWDWAVDSHRIRYRPIGTHIFRFCLQLCGRWKQLLEQVEHSVLQPIWHLAGDPEVLVDFTDSAAGHRMLWTHRRQTDGQKVVCFIGCHKISTSILFIFLTTNTHSYPLEGVLRGRRYPGFFKCMLG